MTKYYEGGDELPGMWTDSAQVMTPEQHLRKLKDEWEEAISGDGGCCPVCGKFGKVYKYKLTQSKALGLRWMQVHADKDGWVEVHKRGPRWMLRSKTHSLLSHWGLVESQGSRSGIWRVTPKGRAFIDGSAVAPKSVWVYDNKVRALDAEETTFRGCFGVKFDFDELMSDQFNWANIIVVED